MINCDVLIIGGGPAGLTAAIYASRANLNTVLLEGSKDIGGQLVLTTEVENFPGFPQGILGPELISRMKKQAEKFGVKVLSEDAINVNFSSSPFLIDSNKNKFKAKSVIVATGARTKWLGIPSEKKLLGRGVSSCATCDGAFFKNKDLFVIGGGDSALEEALFLTRFASSVTVVHRRDKLKASKIMQGRAMKNDKIKFVWNSEVKEVLGDSKVSGIRVINKVLNKSSDLKGDGVFVAIGHEPNTELFKGQLVLDQKGFLVVKNNVFSDKPGVFVCGDVQDHRYKQAITAAAYGCMAAIEAEKYLEDKEK
ncbi:MAG: thioredoxin-disulfide reductase [Nanoarchaeota archaeon]